jgi:NAD(P)-dependent dehydrogenase (short-subunit alcohol dehydrogenase family)
MFKWTKGAVIMDRQQELDLAGQVVIITGASRGIGKQTAIALARRGASLVLTARTVEPGSKLPGTLGETQAQVEQLGASAITVPANLASEADLHRIVDAAVERFGGIDVLVNNAAATDGDYWAKGFLGLPRADWLYQFDVNTHAPFTLMQLVTPIMEARGGGRIINVTTGSGEAYRQPEEPSPVESVGDFSLIVPGYFASKRALDRLANVIAPELARKNIFVIGLLPGLVATEIMTMRVREDGLDDTMAVPMEVPARMVAYFAACANPTEYAGRIFWAERELAELGLDASDNTSATA